MIAASFGIVPWRCESLWHFYMQYTDIMLANKYSAIFKPIAKRRCILQIRETCQPYSVFICVQNVVIVNRDESFTMHPSNYNNSSKFVEFYPFLLFHKVKSVKSSTFYLNRIFVITFLPFRLQIVDIK